MKVKGREKLNHAILAKVNLLGYPSIKLHVKTRNIAREKGDVLLR